MFVEIDEVTNVNFSVAFFLNLLWEFIKLKIKRTCARALTLVLTGQRRVFEKGKKVSLEEREENLDTCERKATWEVWHVTLTY